MLFDPLALPPLLTADLPGIGGRIKQQPEDFEVEEIPAYLPCGSGDFLYLWIEKRDMGAEFFMRQVAKRLGIPPGEVGAAGLKDRHAVTRQWISVPATAESRVRELEGEGVRVLAQSRHGNKLKPGHLHGNRFRILIRGVEAGAATRLPDLVARLNAQGLPNFYGAQRFGRGGETVLQGLSLLRGEVPPEGADGRRPNVRSGFLRKLVLSAAQSALFNHYLAARMAEGLLHRVQSGDVMAKWPAGGMFVAEDLAQEQARFERRETVTAGPIFGRKTFPARGEAAERENRALSEARLSPAAFRGFGKLLQGTRRHNLIWMTDLATTIDFEGVRLTVSLPAGSYATVLLGELMKPDSVPADESAE